MKRPIKQSSFIPKMFRAFTLYFFVTLSVFFGYTHLFKPAAQPTKPGDTQAYEMKPFQEFMANMMSFENIDTDFNLSIGNEELQLTAQGNVVFELAGSALDLDIDLVYNNEIFDVRAKYLQPNFYLEINENVYKFDVSSSGGEMDFNALLSFVSENIGLDISVLSEVGEAIGIDFETFDINEFVAKVTDPEYKKLDTGHRFIFNISNVITAVLDCDENYNIASARVNDIMIKGNAIKFNISNTRMNQPDINVSYGETGDEIDMTGLTEYIGYAQKTFENPYVEANVDVCIDGKAYDAKVYYQNDEKLQLKLETEIEGIEIELAYADEMIYIDAAGQKLSFDVNDYPAWEKEINSIVESQTGKNVSELINDFATANFGQDVAEMTTQQQVMAVLGAFFGNSDKIDAFLPDDTLQTEDDFTMIWNNGLNIKLAQKGNLISNVNVSYDNVTASADLNIIDSGFDIVGEYYDLSQLLPLLPVVDEILTAEQFAGELTVTIDGEQVVADYRVQFASDLLAEIKLEAMGEEIGIYLSGRDVLVQVGELVILGSLDEDSLNSYIARVMAMLGKETEGEDGESTGNAAEVKSIVEQVAGILSDLKISSEEGKIAVFEYLLNTGHILLEANDTVKVHVESGDIAVDATAYATNGAEIVIPTATDTAADMLSKAENVKALVESEQYGFDFEAEYVLDSEETETEECITITGAAQVDLKNGMYAVTNLSALGYTIEQVIYVESENVVYVTYLGNKIKASISSGMSIAEVVMPIVKANIPESEGASEDEKITQEMLSEILVELFGKDVSTLSLKEHLNNLSVNVERETIEADTLTLTGTYSVKQDDDSVKSLTANVEVGFAENNVSSVAVNVEDRVFVDASLLAFATPTFDKDEYYNLTSGHKGQVTISYTDGTETISFVADVEVDLSENIYVRATATIAGNAVELLVRENRFTLSVGEFRVGAYFTDVSEIWESVKALLPTTAETEQEVAAASVEEQESIYTLTGSQVTLNAVELMPGLAISGYLQDEKEIAQVKFADEIENSTAVVYDLSQLLPLLPVVDEILTAEQFAGELTVTIDGEQVVADYRAQFASDLLAEIKLETMGEEIGIYLSGRDVFVQVGELVISGSLDEESLNSYIARVMAMLGKETEDEDAQGGNAAEVKSIVEQVAGILSDLKISSEEGKIAVFEYLLNTGHILLEANDTVKVHVESGDIAVDATVYATNGAEIVIPTATDTAADMLTKAENVKALVESEQYAFEFEAKYVLEETAETETTEESESQEPEYISVTGTAQVDVKNGIYAVSNLSALGYTIDQIIYVESENVVYVTYLGNKIKASISSGMSIAEVVMPIVKANIPESEGTSEDEKTTQEMLSEILVELFGKDVSTLSLKEHLNNLSVNVERETIEADTLTLTGTYGVKQDDDRVKSLTANVEVGFAENNVSSVAVNVEDRVFVDARLLAFAIPTFDKDEYYNLTSGHKGQVTISYTDGTETISFVADVEVDLSENIYVRATATIAGNAVELLVRENRFTLSVGEFRVGAYFSDAAEIWESVKALLPATAETEQEVAAASVEEQESIYTLTGSQVTLNAVELMPGLTISGYLQDEKEIVQVKFADEIENSTAVVYDLSEFLPKVEYIKNYIEAGVYGFGFDFSYNGFPFEGTFKYSNGEMEIVVFDVCGQENFVIRLHDDMVYISYGNMKIKAPISNGSGEAFDYKSIINDILIDAFGVKLQLGTFESLLTMIRDYSWKDYIEKLILGIDYETDKLKLQISKDLGASKDLFAQLIFKFDSQKLTSIEIDALDIVDVKDEQGEIVDTNSLIGATLSVLPAENSQIAEFDEAAYQDYAENYLDGILNSVKVQEDVYAFSSDIAIRYSTTTFYGKLTAMLVAQRDDNGEITGYSPAISVETTALGLNSYIYLIDNMLYIDIHGLQLNSELSETTIEEVLAFVEQEFGVSLGEETSDAAETGEALQQTAEAFKVIIPALDDIYGSWISVVQENETSYGVQINIGDANNDASERLQYAENAFFDDIVLQAFVDTIKAEDSAQGTIIPTKIVLGANITDANTTPRYEQDYFKDSWLSYGTDDNGNAIVMEDSITKQLNFAVYLTNISMGAIDDLGLNGIFGENLKEITSLKANREVDWNSEIDSETGILKAETIRTELKSTSEFNHYQNLLDFADTAYDYAMGMNYQADMEISISSQTGESTKIYGDATVQLSDLTDEQIANNTFVLFGNKALKVQGNLAVENSTNGTLDNKHLIDLLYQSDNDAALYVTYSHDDYSLNENGVDAENNNHIALGNKFKGKIANTNLSEIVSMLLSFAKIEVGEDIEKALGIDDKPCTTDFDYVQSLLGIGGQDISEDTSKVDQLLSSIENITKMVESITLSKTDSNKDGLCDTALVIKVNMKHFNEVENEQIATITILTKEELLQDASGNAVVVRKLRYLSIENLVYGTSTINAAINFGDFDTSLFNYVTGEEEGAAESDKHIDFSKLSSFIDVAVSTINTKNFNFKGQAQIIIDLAILEIDFEIGIDMFASLSDTGEVYMYIELDVPSIIDVTYDSGGFGSTYTYYSALMGFDKRISIIEYNGTNLTVTQNTYGYRESGFHKRSDKFRTFDPIPSSEISKNIMLIMTQALGFTDTVYEGIDDLIKDMNPNPSLEETIQAFSYSDTNLILSVDGPSLTGDSQFKDMDLTIGLSSDYTTQSRNFKFIDSISTTLEVSIVKIPVTLYSVSGNSYTETYESKKGSVYSKTYNTNHYYRNKYLEKFA